MKVIVNADDFGTNKRINSAIVSGIEAKRITSASIIANGIDFGAAVSFAKEHPEISFGIHLNIVCGPPILSNEDVVLPLMENGCFLPLTPRSAIRYSWLRGIYAEWAAQINRVRQAGVTISHIDSECHLHTHPMLIMVVNRLMSNFGIKRMRNTKNIYHPKNRSHIPLLCTKRFWTSTNRYLFGKHLTDYFTDLNTFARGFTHICFDEEKTIEIMVHPGMAHTEKENECLMGEQFFAIFKHHSLITYDQL